MSNTGKIIKTRIQGFEIHHAEEKDVRLIHSLIRELAEYEKMLDEMISETEYLKKCFDY